MNKISLLKVHSTAGGSYHVKLVINNNDVGILYLKEEEVEILLNALRNGRDSDSVVDSDIYESEEEDFDVDNEDEND